MAAAQVLPKELRLAAPPTMPRARSYLYKQQSTQSSYNLGETIQINLPRLQRSYLTKDSYIKFALKVTAGGTADTSGKAVQVCLDTPGAYGLIDKIEVYDYLGSTLLESTSGHGQLMALLMDMSIGVNGATTHHNFIDGTWVAAAIGGVTPVGTVATANTTATDADTTRFVTTSGAPILTTGTTTATTTYIREFALPIFSFLGLLSTKYAPLHNGYTINITLNPIATALGAVVFDNSSTTLAGQQALNPHQYISTAKLLDVYYCCQVLELGAEAESLLATSTGGQPLIVPTKAFRNYQGAIPASTGSYRLDLNLNVASLTNILWMMRPSTNLSNGATRTLSDRVRNFLQTWYFQYGSSILPQTAGIQCRSRSSTSTSDQYYGPGGAYDASEAYIELMKARHAFNQPVHTQKLGLKEYTQDTLASTALLCIQSSGTGSRFAAGLDLELVSGRSNDMICGMNTNGMNTSIYANFDLVAASTNSVAVRVDAWCEYDAFINVMPGIATTVSF